MTKEYEYTIKQKNQAYYDLKESQYDLKCKYDWLKLRRKYNNKSNLFSQQEIHLNDFP